MYISRLAGFLFVAKCVDGKHMYIEKQNRKIAQLLMDLNHDLELRENREIQVSLLELIGYAILGVLAFIIFMGILRALLWRLP